MTQQDTAISIRLWITIEMLLGLANADPGFRGDADRALAEWFERVEESRLRLFAGEGR